MSDFFDGFSAEERVAWLRLEKWLIDIVGKKLSVNEQLIGQALIMDMRRALGLPLLGTNPGYTPTAPNDLKSNAGPSAHPTEENQGANIIPMRKR